MLRCKLCLDRKPRAVIFENVVPFPIALLKDVTGVVCNICVHTKCDHLIQMWWYIYIYGYYISELKRNRLILIYIDSDIDIDIYIYRFRFWYWYMFMFLCYEFCWQSLHLPLAGPAYYVAEEIILDPREAGFPVARKRKYVLLLRNDMLPLAQKKQWAIINVISFYECIYIILEISEVARELGNSGKHVFGFDTVWDVQAKWMLSGCWYQTRDDRISRITYCP